ncbi:MFS transporter [Candidatus Bathyarchaeota archaeon]|nr:MFS transporter [Candidatus Bathyarchaeota archaeon]
MASALRGVLSNRNVMTISLTNMLYNVFNNLWMLWWSLYLVEEMNTPVTVIGLLSMIQMTGSILFQLPGGMLADKYGRKKVIVYGTSLRVIGALLLYAAPTWEWIIPGLIINALTAVYNPAFSAIIADSMPRQSRGSAFGAYRMFTSLPGVFMPYVSGYYLEVLGIKQGVKLGLLMFSVAAAIATLVRARYLQETISASKTDTKETQEKDIALLEVMKKQPRTIWAMFSVSVITGFIGRMTASFIPIYAYNVVGLSTTQYGLLQSTAMGLSTPLYMVGGMISDKIGRVPPILVARGFSPLGSLSLLFFKDYTQLLGVWATYGLIEGLGGGSIRGGGFMGGPAWEALMAELVLPKFRGRVTGFMASGTGLLTFPASYIGGYIYNLNPDMLVGLTAVQFLVVPIILFFVKEPKKESQY